MAERDLHQVLGLKPGANAEEMKRAYRTLAKKLHPDSSGRAASGLEFSRVVQAYRALMIEERRKRIIAFPSAARGAPTPSAWKTAAAAPRRPAKPQPVGGRPPGHAASSAGKRPGLRPDADPQPQRQPATDVFKMGRLLLTGREPALRAFAARALGNAGRRTAYAFLRKALLDREETVVRAALCAIGKLSIMQSAGELAALYARSGPAVRRDVLLCVQSILLRHAARTPTLDGFASIVTVAATDAEPEIRALASHLLRDGE